MMYPHRLHSVTKIETPEQLAENLNKETTWCLCTGWMLNGYLFLNDSTSEDGVGEWAVFHNNFQIESITFGWCTKEESLKYIKKIVEGEYNEAAWDAEFNLNHPEGTCRHCA